MFCCWMSSCLIRVTDCEYLLMVILFLKLGFPFGVVEPMCLNGHVFWSLVVDQLDCARPRYFDNLGLALPLTPAFSFINFY